jgi:hypothetical protein
MQVNYIKCFKQSYSKPLLKTVFAWNSLSNNAYLWIRFAGRLNRGILKGIQILRY